MGAAQERPVWQAVKTYWSLLLGNALEWYEFCLYSFLEPYFEAGVSWVEPGSAQVRSQVLELVSYARCVCTYRTKFKKYTEQSSKNTQSEFVGLKQSGFEHLQRFFNQPID